MMDICITSTGDSINSRLDPRFGRCVYFFIFDADSGDHIVIGNEAAYSGGGAGIRSGQLMADKNVKILITGNVGPNAMNVLKNAGIEIYRGIDSSVQDNIDGFRSGLLKKITETVAPHTGLDQKGGS